jgi:hypothetical protein
MDPALIQLAASAATTLVNAMTSDAWSAVRDRFANLLSRDGARDAGDVVRELDAARSRIEVADPDRRGRVADAIERDLQADLTRTMSTVPGLAAEVEAAIADYSRQAGAFNTANTTITLAGNAADNARIYQQGQGVQHNN